MNDTLIILSLCVVLPTIIALLVLYAIYRRLTPKPASTETRQKKRAANPLLSALATVCLLVVFYLILFTSIDNLPLVVLFALIGLAFGSAARK